MNAWIPRLETDSPILSQKDRSQGQKALNQPKAAEFEHRIEKKKKVRRLFLSVFKANFFSDFLFSLSLSLPLSSLFDTLQR
jgi:hypothetical protein